jgi:putative NADPH-quinone reductase
MQVLIVYGQPRADGFCSALRDAHVSGLRAAGHGWAYGYHKRGYDLGRQF